MNLHATPDSLARFYSGLLAGGILDGRRLLSAALVADVVSAHARQFCDAYFVAPLSSLRTKAPTAPVHHNGAHGWRRP